MDRNEQEALFRRARIALNEGTLTEAGAMFAELVENSDCDARFLSYRGLLLAIRERRVSEGVAMCRQAIALAPSEPEMHLNLSRLYESTGQHENAVETLRRAIRSGVRTDAVMNEIQRLSPRAEPPLPSLHRDHFLNDVLGKLRARLFGKRRRSGSRANASHPTLVRIAREARQRG
jgi:tetratricopeptide (TPR) repeat protein